MSVVTAAWRRVARRMLAVPPVLGGPRPAVSPCAGAAGVVAAHKRRLWQRAKI